jgi:hypothetical protein
MYHIWIEENGVEVVSAWLGDFDEAVEFLKLLQGHWRGRVVRYEFTSKARAREAGKLPPPDYDNAAMIEHRNREIEIARQD